MEKSSIQLVLFVAAYVLFWALPAVFLGRNKQRSFIQRFMLGFVLGPIGWLIAWKLGPGKPRKSSAEVREDWRAQEAQREREKAEWKGERG